MNRNGTQTKYNIFNSKLRSQKIKQPKAKSKTAKKPSLLFNTSPAIRIIIFLLSLKIGENIPIKVAKIVLIAHQKQHKQLGVWQKINMQAVREIKVLKKPNEEINLQSILQKICYFFLKLENMLRLRLIRSCKLLNTRYCNKGAVCRYQNSLQ
ncbi:hypothetical protein TTHERM_001079289 (macronuclear) [Tetrahymena thermophila SB210]|uniref:Uncharacterized protein n=1 Tax=Tetrahymena thermophila (strain SB210) TaxID=312017 RepID=W7WXJ7_TETTS|nr:hypothetical protein TTHERM_001079289 [Tetrahymena thermophila SB210]EWS71535.1 hypothetical protein TTHERM_001079289 [Tetrahymena thermophila SB210]|eukprot:XP_012655931.1 hypothetical protein TTHERM_001079289 [Tetrahymena thermophila SB210]